MIRRQQQGERRDTERTVPSSLNTWMIRRQDNQSEPSPPSFPSAVRPDWSAVIHHPAIIRLLLEARDSLWPWRVIRFLLRIFTASLCFCKLWQLLLLTIFIRDQYVATSNSQYFLLFSPGGCFELIHILFRARRHQHNIYSDCGC